ncbi:DUF4129 domain-containing protein [Oryzobacter telluris]|uniref:DUF4129 domain-containing protein n=1 Tax=Oryzobacter telluris TaxID=3149179 RepID=UPI00370D1000
MAERGPDLLSPVRADPPLDPTSPEARQWLEDELRRGIYHEQKGLLARLWEWLGDILGRTVTGAGLPAWTIWVAIIVGVLVVGLVLARSLRSERRMTGRSRGGVLDGPVRTAAEHRADARAALAAGDHDTAVLEGYRAIARAAVERTLLDDLPGRTAHEVSVQLVPVFPAHGGPLATAADTFDAVRYGRRTASADAARAVVDLDETLSTTRPVLPELPDSALVVTP